MEIHEVRENRKRYLPLLLLADEQEDMIDRYLPRGWMFVLDDGGVKAECVVTKEADGVYELKNLAVEPAFQGRGYGRALIEYVFVRFPDCRTLLAGTGDSPLTVPFYEKCGFREFRRIRNFFTDNYDHPIIEAGVPLRDMVVLKRDR